MNFAVEVLSRNDAAAVTRLVEIEQGAFGSHALSEWEIVPFIRHGLVAMLKLNGEIVGGAQFLRDWRQPHHAYLFGIAVDASFQGMGFGTRFLSECLTLLKEHCIQSVELTVDASNLAAIKVYQQKLGFETTQIRKGEYGDGEDRFVMIKLL
jgi:ribosomal-protein-alanine N-acetyltransferase